MADIKPEAWRKYSIVDKLDPAQHLAHPKNLENIRDQIAKKKYSLVSGNPGGDDTLIKGNKHYVLDHETLNIHKFPEYSKVKHLNKNWWEDYTKEELKNHPYHKEIKKEAIMNGEQSAYIKGFVKRAMEHGLTEKQAVNIMPFLKATNRLLGRVAIPASAGALGLGAGLGYGSSNVGNKIYDKVVFQNHLPEKINNITENLQNASESMSKTVPIANNTLESLNNILNNKWVKPLAIGSLGLSMAYPFYSIYNSHKDKKIKEKQNEVLEKMLKRLK